MAIPIRAALALNTEAFDRGISRAQAGLRTLQGAFGGIITAARRLTLAFTGLLVGLGAIITRQTGVISSLQNLSTQLNVNVQFLQRFRFAAEQTGAGAATADNAIQRLNRRLAEAARGTGAARDVLRQYGIALRDNNGELRSTEDVLMDVSDAMASVESGAERNRIAYQLFGREGQALVNTLQGGRAELQGMFTDADRLGIVLSQSATEGVTRFGDAWNRLQQLIGGLTNNLTAGLAPALEVVVNRLVSFIQDVAEAHGGFEELGKYLAGEFIRIMQNVVLVFVHLYNVIANILNSLNPIIRRFGVGAASELDDLTRRAQAFQDVMDGISRPSAANLRGPSAELLTEVFGSVSEAMKPENILSATQLLEQAARELESAGATLEQIPLIDTQNIMDFFDQLQGAVRRVPPLEITITEGNLRETEQHTRTWWQKLLDWMKSSTEGLFGEGIFQDVAQRMQLAFERAELHTPGKTLADGFISAFQLAEDALTNFITSGKLSFSSLGRHIRDTLARAFVQQQIMGPLLSMFGLGSLPIPGSRDAGGRGNAGQPYLIGRGAQPELFIPDSPGQFIPRNSLQNAQSQSEPMQITYNINATDARSFRDLVAADPEFIYSVTQVGSRRLPR